MADIEKLQAELQMLRAENAQLKDELKKSTALTTEKSVFQTLNEYDISEHIKKKDKIIYLPWSKAWMILKTLYPDSKVEVIENAGFDSDDVVRYFTDGKTAWVKVAITIKGHTETESLAIMDFRNKSIPVANITSADVEKSIKRCMVKCAALHGLGLSLWTGEELSSAAREKKELIWTALSRKFWSLSVASWRPAFRRNRSTRLLSPSQAPRTPMLSEISPRHKR